MMLDLSAVLNSDKWRTNHPGSSRDLDRTPHRLPIIEATFPSCILFAEDDAELRSVLASALRKQSYEVIECSNGQELLDHLDCFAHPSAADDFDLIISDIRMPGANGLAILEGLQHCQGYPPMLLITAFGDEATHEEAHRLGALGVLDKPFEIVDLVTRVSEILP